MPAPLRSADPIQGLRYPEHIDVLLACHPLGLGPGNPWRNDVPS